MQQSYEVGNGNRDEPIAPPPTTRWGKATTISLIRMGSVDAHLATVYLDDAPEVMTTRLSGCVDDPKWMTRKSVTSRLGIQNCGYSAGQQDGHEYHDKIQAPSGEAIGHQ